jgi:hypothetical protein
MATSDINIQKDKEALAKLVLANSNLSKAVRSYKQRKQEGPNVSQLSKSGNQIYETSVNNQNEFVYEEPNPEEHIYEEPINNQNKIVYEEPKQEKGFFRRAIEAVAPFPEVLQEPNENKKISVSPPPKPSQVVPTLDLSKLKQQSSSRSFDETYRSSSNYDDDLDDESDMYEFEDAYSEYPENINKTNYEERPESAVPSDQQRNISIVKSQSARSIGNKPENNFGVRPSTSAYTSRSGNLNTESKDPRLSSSYVYKKKDDKLVTLPPAPASLIKNNPKPNPFSNPIRSITRENNPPKPPKQAWI